MATFNRESIKNGFFQDFVTEGERLGLFIKMSEEDRIASRQAMLDSAPDPDNIWVFAYGSLLWNPAFHFERSIEAKLYGYHRAFCLQTEIGRGSVEHPGLLLGLDRGGSCRGLAYKLHKEQVCEELDIVWSREMVTNAYTPRWIKLQTPDGPIPGIGFVMAKDNDRYVTGLSIDKQARMIALAEGVLGPCSEYLENTVKALDDMGIGDGPLHILLNRMQEIKDGS